MNAPPNSDATAGDTSTAPFRARLGAALAAFAVAAVVGWWASAILLPWVATARFPGAYVWSRGWPLVFALSLGAGLGLGALRRANGAALAGALVGTGVAALVAATLPHAASNTNYGDGPFLMPVYAAVVALLSIYVPAGPRRHSAAARIAVAALVLCTANTLPFARESSATIALVACAAGLVLLAAPPRRDALFGAGASADRFARGARVILLALPVWIGVAALLGDSVTRGLFTFQSVAVGALLAYALATRLDVDGVRRAVFALALGAVLLVAAAALSEADAIDAEGAKRVLTSRLRLFGAHPNQIGPAFAGAAVLCGVLATLRREGEAAVARWSRAALLIVVALACLFLLWRTASRASSMGFAIGAVFALVVAFARLPRRPGRWALVAGALAVLGVGLWATPLADPARAWLTERAAEPNSAIGQRYHYWRMSADAIADHPLTGTGPAQYYVHARYAEPSYYDGTRQSFHPHNVLFAIAEGTGLPGLALFLALVGVMLEFGRRAVLALPRGSRALAIAPLAASVGMLATNLFDLGQVQPTFVPLHVWITTALCAVLAGGAARGAPGDAGPAEEHARARPWGTFALLVPLGLLPLVADGLIHSGRLLAFAQGEPQRGYDRIALGRTLFPAHPRAWDWEYSLLARLGRGGADTLDARRAETRRTPGNAEVWLELAGPLLRANRFDEAAEAIERAIELDPRGPRVGEALMLRVWVEMRAGRVEDARETLFQALVHESLHWTRLPHAVRSAPDGHNGRRVVLSTRSKDGALVELELDEALERLGTHTLRIANERPYDARRNLLTLYSAYVGLGRPTAALPWFERYMEVVGAPIPSILNYHALLLLELGLKGRVEELLESCDPRFRRELEQSLRTSQILMDPARRRGVDAETVAWILEPIEESDIFEEADEFNPRLELSVGFHAAIGDWDHVLADARRVLRTYEENAPRRAAAERILSTHFIGRDAPATVVLEFVARTIHVHDVEVRREGRITDFLAGVAARVYTNWLPSEGDLVERARAAVGGTGPAGDLLVEHLERLHEKDRPTR